MSTHRLVVRDALVAKALASTSLTPFKNLDYALEDKNLPALAITAGADEAAPEITTTTMTGGWAQFVVHILVAQSADPEAGADSIEQLLRDSLQADPTLGGAVIQLKYLGGEWEFFLGDCVVRRLIFNALFIH